MIAASDLKLIYATDSVDEAIAHIRNKAIEPSGLKQVMRRDALYRCWARGDSAGRSD